MKTCKECKYFQRYCGENSLGDCRKRAPIADKEYDGVFPIMFADEWCGELELKKD